MCYNNIETIYKEIYIAKYFRRNWQIQSPKVFLIGQDGQPIGIKPTEEAVKSAKEQEVDLVEIAPNANPPVCKIMDFGKFLYEQEKTDRKHRAKQKSGGLKELRLSLKIGAHDREMREKKAAEFLSEGYKVKISLRLIGREAMFADQAFVIVNNVLAKLADQSTVIQHPKREGKIISTIVQPKTNQKEQKTDEK